MSDCIFCKIAAGEIPSFKVYEDDNLLAILDRFPGTEGTVLILTKRHTSDIHELNDAEASEILPLAKRVAEKIKAVLYPDGINILQNNGKAAGQEVFHYHMHVIPRYKNDSIRFSKPPTKPSDSELEKISDKLKL